MTPCCPAANRIPGGKKRRCPYPAPGFREFFGIEIGSPGINKIIYPRLGPPFPDNFFVCHFCKENAVSMFVARVRILIFSRATAMASIKLDFCFWRRSKDLAAARLSRLSLHFGK